MPEMSSRVQPSLRAQGRDFADALRTSTGIQGRLPFEPKVMGSIPTAPTIHRSDGWTLSKFAWGRKGADEANDPVLVR
jgi:hypothetical protein